jgi:hypothetical protein
MHHVLRGHPGRKFAGFTFSVGDIPNERLQYGGYRSTDKCHDPAVNGPYVHRRFSGFNGGRHQDHKLYLLLMMI